MPTLEITGAVISVLIGLIGIIVGIVEHRARTKSETISRAYLFSHFNRVRAMTPYRAEIERVLEGVDAKPVNRWCWVIYKGMSDLYANTVAHYLASQEKFTYEHLQQLTQAGIVETTWEETIWRDLIALRRENMDGNVPERSIKATSVELGTSVRLGTYSPSLRGEDKGGEE